jgi:hypothetical protein
LEPFRKPLQFLSVIEPRLLFWSNPFTLLSKARHRVSTALCMRFLWSLPPVLNPLPLPESARAPLLRYPFMNAQQSV